MRAWHSRDDFDFLYKNGGISRFLLLELGGYGLVLAYEFK